MSRRVPELAMPVAAWATFLAVMVFVGCTRVPPRPVPPADTEMGRYFAAFQENIGDALGRTAGEVDGLTESEYRDRLAANLLEAITKSHAELSAADQAMSDSGYTPEKAREMLLRRQRECARGQ